MSAFTPEQQGELNLLLRAREEVGVVPTMIRQLQGRSLAAFAIGTRAARPAANAVAPGSLYYATDTGVTSRSDGVSWTAIYYEALLVTALPTSPAPIEGQLIDLLVDPVNGVVWRLRYRAASASPWKWEFVGGPPLWSAQTAGGAVNGAAVQAIPNSPSLTLPCSGDYDIDLFHYVSLSVTGSGNFCFTYLQRNATGVNIHSWQHNLAALFTVEYPSMQARVLGMTAGDVMAPWGAGSGGASSCSYGVMSIRARPVRVG